MHVSSATPYIVRNVFYSYEFHEQDIPLVQRSSAPECSIPDTCSAYIDGNIVHTS